MTHGQQFFFKETSNIHYYYISPTYVWSRRVQGSEGWDRGDSVGEPGFPNAHPCNWVSFKLQTWPVWLWMSPHAKAVCICSKSSDLFISRKLMSSFKKDNNQKHKRKSVTDGLNILSSLLQMLACPAN